MLVLMLFSLVVLLVFGPLYLTTTISTSATGMVSWNTYYPISIFPVIPWIILVSVLSFFIVSVIIFIGIVAVLGSRINLAATLNASWAEAAPYGGDV